MSLLDNVMGVEKCQKYHGKMRLINERNDLFLCRECGNIFRKKFDKIKI